MLIMCDGFPMTTFAEYTSGVDEVVFVADPLKVGIVMVQEFI